MHPDLAVDPLGILRPATKLTHTLPLVIHIHLQLLLLFFIKPFNFLIKRDHVFVLIKKIRLVHTHHLQELGVDFMSNKRGELTLQQMNHCLQIAHATSLAPLTTYTLSHHLLICLHLLSVLEIS